MGGGWWGVGGGGGFGCEGRVESIIRTNLWILVIQLVWEILHVHLSGKSQGIKKTSPLWYLMQQPLAHSKIPVTNWDITTELHPAPCCSQASLSDPHDSINEFIIQRLNSLVVVGFRFIYKCLPGQFSWVKC